MVERSEARRIADDLDRRMAVLRLVRDRNGESRESWDGIEYDLMVDPLEVTAAAKITADGTVYVGDVVVLLACGGPHVDITFRTSDDAFVEHVHGGETSRAYLQSGTAEEIYGFLGLDMFDDFDGRQVQS